MRRKLMPRSSTRGPSGTDRSAVTRISTSCTARRSGRNTTRSSTGKPVRCASSWASSKPVKTFSGRKIVDSGASDQGGSDSMPGFHGPWTTPAAAPVADALIALCALALGIEERLLRDPRGGALPAVLHGDFHLQGSAGRGAARLEVGQGDVLLEQRRPTAARRVADLIAADVERRARAPGRGWQARGEADLRIEAFERIPLHLDADELPERSAALLLGERALPDELLLVEIHGPAEVELEGRGGLARDERLARRDVVDVHEHQSRLDPGDIEREHPHGRDAIRRAGLDDRVPDRERAFGVEPDLEAEVTRVAGPRDRDGNAAEPRRGEPEVPQAPEVGLARALEDRARARPLQRECRGRLGHVLDRDAEAGRVRFEPAHVGIGGGQAEGRFVQARDRAIVEHLAGGVAPGRVENIAHL